MAYYLLAGFIAQLSDAFLGMGFGVILSSLLAFSALSATAITASIHFAEVFTTLGAGATHYRFRNFNPDILLSLAAFGAVGALAGANLSLSIQQSSIVPFAKVFTSAILLLLGGLVVVRYWPFGSRTAEAARPESYRAPHRKRIGIIGFIGAFVDVFAGGGWGPVTGVLLLNSNYNPKEVVGSVLIAEFFITLITSLFFAAAPSIFDWRVIPGILVGGIAASILAAYFVRRISGPALRFLFGLFTMILSTITILRVLL